MAADITASSVGLKAEARLVFADGTSKEVVVGKVGGVNAYANNSDTEAFAYGNTTYNGVVVKGNFVTFDVDKDGKYNLNCAVIVKRVDAQTRSKTSINELLRD